MLEIFLLEANIQSIIWNFRIKANLLVEWGAVLIRVALFSDIVDNHFPLV
jgi:hypothetical protein